MKKTLCIFLALMLVVCALAGCGSEPAANPQPTDPPRETAKTTSHAAAEAFAGGSGTQEDPFQISEAGHLVLLHEMLKKEEAETNFDDTYVEGYYVLTADIALNDTADFANWGTQAPEYGWVPIGAGLSLNSFAGVLDGNGHTITGMFIDADNTSGSTYADLGLFAKMEGTVKNLTVQQSFIRASGGLCNVGIITGSTFSKDAVIENCAADAVVELYGACEAGGIVGSAGSAAITGCTSSAVITQLDEGVSHIGGISGSNGAIDSCIFTGTLSGKGDTGGIVGYGDQAKNCVNRGSVSGDRAGGISGNAFHTGMGIEIQIPQRSIDSCVNEGEITGIALAGGIVGTIYNGESDISMSVVNCENRGAVRCDEAAAGIICQLTVECTGPIKVENCVNHVDISGNGKTGGILCELKGAILHQEGDVSISGCRNLGSITSGDQYSAGILTYLLIMGDETDLRLTVENCVNEGAIQSTGYAGGILGFSNVGFNASVSSLTISDTTAVSLRSCANSGSVTATTPNSMAGGIVGVLGLGGIPTEVSGCVNSGTVSVDFTLTDQQTEELQGSEWPEYYQIGGGIIGRIGDALKLTTAEDGETSPDRVNAADGTIVITGCRSTGAVTAPDYSVILNAQGEPLYVNYLGGIVGQCSAAEGYAFRVENCIYSGTGRGLGSTEYADIGTKN